MPKLGRVVGVNWSISCGMMAGMEDKRNDAPPTIRSDVPLRKPQRADARRNQQALLAAAAAVFVTSGVEAPVRDIAAAAGVGMGTIYRHFPTRADLIVAVYRHQVEACAEAAQALLAQGGSPHAALSQWANL